MFVKNEYKMTPSIKNLQYLVALKKTNHFSNAAKECFVSASTFSAGISKLENDLQVQLVERDNKKVRFTSAGNRISASDIGFGRNECIGKHFKVRFFRV